MRTLIWFRSDLRRADNAALRDACLAGDEGVVGLFLLAPEQWREQGWGAPRVDFVLRSLGALSERLAEWGVPLLVRRADRYDEAAAAVVAAARAAGCSDVIYNREIGRDETQRDCEVDAACREAGLKVVSLDERTVVPPGSLVTKAKGTPYSVYTPFRRAWGVWLDAHGWPAPQGEPPRPLAGAGVGVGVGVAADPVPASLPGFALPVKGLSSLWPAGEEEAARRLSGFLAGKADGYADGRDRFDLDGTSSLSPYLACGALAPGRCVAAVRPLSERRAPAGEGARVWLNQLVWREFYLHVLAGFPKVGRGEPFRDAGNAIPWRDDDEGFDRWCRGETGYPVVDAAMRQLAATGWMHNRLRMVAAMFLTKDLLIDWRRGERFFLESLVDADLANNNGGWQWVAGTGTDASPFHRVFNPVTQSKRFDPRGAFLRRWLPELEPLNAKEIHAPWTASDALIPQLSYPERVVDHAEARTRFLQVLRDLRPSA